MRISNGISEIQFHNPVNDVKPEKVFVWPVYNGGRIEQIHGVTRQTDSNGIYAMPSREDRDKIFMISANRSEETYTQRGNRQGYQPLQPGSLFEAVV